MAFGEELKDFVNSFQAGYKMVKSKDEREWEKEERQMKRESHEWGREGTLYDREYREGRDLIGDDRWERQFGESVRNQRWREGVDERNFEYNADRDTIEDQWRHLRRGDEITRDKLGPGGEDAELPGALNDSYERRENLYRPMSYGGAGNEEAMVQNAAYSAADNTGGFDLRSYLDTTRQRESGGKSNARNPRSTATGDYQFLKGTWNELRQKYPELRLTADGRTNRAQQERAMLRFTYDNGKALQRAGVPVTNGTMYAAHFLGAGGASKVLRADPSTPVTRLVSPEVIHANPFLRGMNVNDFRRWAEGKGRGNRQRQRTAVNVARGGMISRPVIPDNEEEDDDLVIPASMMEGGEEVGAIPTPEDGPRPLPRPEYEGGETGTPVANDRVSRAREAVRQGAEWALKQSQADYNAPIDDPELEQRRLNYMRGYGAAPQQLLRQAMDLVDPDKEMPLAERNIMAIGVVHNFYTERGEYEKAQAAAGTMYQAEKQASQQMWSLAQAAASNGDIDNAVKAAVAAYAHIPNGIDFQVQKTEDGNYEVKFEDLDGNELSKEILDPKRMAEMAMSFGPGTYDNAILDAAGIAAASRSDRSVADLSSIDENVGAEFEDDEELAAMDMNTNQRREFRRIVNDIAKDVEYNGMTPSDAQTFALRLIQFDQNDLENPETPFDVNHERGGELVTIMDKQTGETVRMSTNAYRNLEGLRGDMQSGRQARADKSQRRGENVQSIIDNAKWFGGAAMDAAKGATLGGTVRGVIDDVTNLPPLEVYPQEESDQIDNLLAERSQLVGQVAGGNAPEARQRIREIDQQLEQLGYQH